MTSTSPATRHETSGAAVSVSVDSVDVRYKVYAEQRLTLRELSARKFRRRSAAEVHAVKNVSFDVHRGEALGIIGSNGSGKSTLLRTIAGLQTPSAGRVRVTAQPRILGVGATLQPTLSGYRNIYLGSLAMGLRTVDVDRVVDDIIEWTELQDAIYRPLHTYSSGMRARLAFAIATLQTPEIMLIDEALAVGDQGFRRKSLERLKEMKRSAGTILMVTHNLSEIQQTCSRAVWLDKGTLVLDGDVDDVIKRYQASDDAGPPATSGVV